MSAASPLSADKSSKSVTGNRSRKKDEPVTGNRSPKNDESVTGNKGVKSPGKKRKVKPLDLAGYSWRDDGAGWQLRRIVNENGKRKFPYVAHMSRSAWQEMKREYSGPALRAEVQAWIDSKTKGGGK